MATGERSGRARGRGGAEGGALPPCSCATGRARLEHAPWLAELPEREQGGAEELRGRDTERLVRPLPQGAPGVAGCVASAVLGRRPAATQPVR